jgi:ABC-type nitrate/sulfonate/bicarbonate transport system ATPase subunit
MISAISAKGLGFSWPGATPLFEGFDLEIGQGETWAILGSSGSGKTSLLMLFAGLLSPTSGELLVAGERLSRPRPRTGLILQDYGLLPWATVRDNVGLGLRVRDFYGPDGVHAPSVAPAGRGIDHWLERLSIAGIADRYPAEISGGQRQRTAVARSLALEPDILLMDEPFSSVDEIIREDLQALTLALREEGGLTLVIVTHSIEEAAKMGRKVLVLGRTPNRQARVVENPSFGALSEPALRDARGALRSALELP